MMTFQNETSLVIEYLTWTGDDTPHDAHSFSFHTRSSAFDAGDSESRARTARCYSKSGFARSQDWKKQGILDFIARCFDRVVVLGTRPQEQASCTAHFEELKVLGSLFLESFGRTAEATVLPAKRMPCE